MELNYTKKQLLAAYDQLPELVREAISQINMVATIKAIGEKYQLHIDQTGDLSHEIGLVLVGLLSPTDFLQNIQRKLYLTSDQAKEIAATVNLEIFNRVQESVKGLSEEVLTPAPATVETPVPPAEMGEGIVQMFNLPKGSGPAAPTAPPVAAPSQPWDEDPYLEKP